MPLITAKLFCVSTVSTVCPIKEPVQSGAGGDLDSLHVHVADAADGADGGMVSVLTYGSYPDCSHSLPFLSAEDNFNPNGAQQGLGAAHFSERTKLRRVRLVAERSFPSFEADPTFRLYPGKR